MSGGQIMPMGQITRRKAQFIGTANGRPYGWNELTRGVMNWLGHEFSLRSVI